MNVWSRHTCDIYHCWHKHCAASVFLPISFCTLYVYFAVVLVPFIVCNFPPRIYRAKSFCLYKDWDFIKQPVLASQSGKHHDTSIHIYGWISKAAHAWSCLQISTLNDRASSYLHQPVVGCHLENPLLHYLKCLLLEEVVGTCQDSPSCLHCCCDILKWASAGFHLYFLLQVFSQSFYSKREMVPHVKGVKNK